MEQARYWMWTKRRHGLNSADHLDESWEEQAFAEDAAGSLGGCIWPPRSYSCSFCGREFRSAQALGGHMNVHRRDRARLKQSPTPHDDQILQHQQTTNQNLIQNPFLPLGFQYQPDQVCNFVYNPNPNSNHSTTLPSPSPPPCLDKTLVPPFSSSPILQQHSKKSPNSSPKSLVAADRYYHFSDLRSQGDNSSSINIESGCKVKADYVQTDLSVSLNLVVRRKRSTTSGSKEETSIVGCKRKRNIDDDDIPTLPFFLKPISIDQRHRFQPADDELTELISPSSSVDDIDLELRLGDRPKGRGLISTAS